MSLLLIVSKEGYQLDVGTAKEYDPGSDFVLWVRFGRFDHSPVTASQNLCNTDTPGRCCILYRIRIRGRYVGYISAVYPVFY
jgi:hypothetical protein